MKIKTQELKKAIKSCLAGTDTKDLVMQMSHLVFNEEEILAYNDKVSIMVPFESGINCSIPAEDLNKVLSGISDKELEMIVDGDEVKIISEGTEAILSTEIESRIVEEFFSNVDFEKMDWYELPKNFMDQLSLARYSASSNALDANNLFCVCIRGNTISSGDGHRLSKLTIDTEMEEVLIPSSSVNDIVGFNDFDEYSVNKGWIHLSNEDGVILSCRTVIGDFPDFSKIFKGFQEETKVVVDSNLIPILQNLGGLVSGQVDFMRSVSITITKGTTIISGKKEGLRIEKKIENKHTKEDVQFSISPDFLQYILSMTNTLSIGGHSAMFSSKTFQHIVQLPVG